MIDRSPASVAPARERATPRVTAAARVAPPSGAPRRAPSPRRGRSAKSRTLLFLRRVHLYSGLFLVPWVVVYGLSAALFNHPSWMPGRTSASVGSEAFDGTSIAGGLDADAYAAQVVDALRARFGDEGTAFDAPRDASWDGALYYQAEEELEDGGSRTHFLRVDLAGRGARHTTRSSGPSAEPAPFAVDRGLELESDPARDAVEELPAQAAALGLGAAEGLRLRVAPDLAFVVDVDGEPWRARYDVRGGSLEAVPADAPQDGEALRRHLTRLHLTHGYTPWWSAETAWALFVDAMAAAMLLWAATGIVMWWPMKKLRSAGLWTLAASVATAAAVIAPLLG